jgi:ABC-type glycerol-3-phosphate transport system permease component
MTYIITYIIIGIFLSLLFLNLYFRIKVFKVYKVLVQNRIEFNSSHIFNKDKMEKEVLSRYPKFTSEILSFTGHIKKSILIAVILVLLITIMGIILKNI